MVMVLASTLAEVGVATRRLGGTIGFFVNGAQGGRWVVDLSTPGGLWRELVAAEPAPQVGTAIVSTDRSFANCFLEPTTIPALLARGDLAVLGDTSRLRRLAELLAAGGSMLELRARGA
jgi:hypothetical protein